MVQDQSQQNLAVYNTQVDSEPHRHWKISILEKKNISDGHIILKLNKTLLKSFEQVKIGI